MRRHPREFAGALMAALLLLSAGPAQAACGVYGKIVRVFANTQAATPYSYVYVMPQTTSINAYAHYFYVGPNESAALATITAAAAANQKVRLVGNASSCKTSGTWRYGGKLLSANFFSLY